MPQHPHTHQPITLQKTPVYSTNSVPAHLLGSVTPAPRHILRRSPILPLPLIILSLRRHILLSLL